MLVRHLVVIAICASLAACGQGAAPATPAVASTPITAVHTPPPTYPDALACNGVGGTVDLRVRIETNGSIGDVAIERSSGNAQLDQAAIAGVRQWEFRAATRGGQPYAQTIAVPMTFHVPTVRPDRCFALDEKH